MDLQKVLRGSLGAATKLGRLGNTCSTANANRDVFHISYNSDKNENNYNDISIELMLIRGTSKIITMLTILVIIVLIKLTTLIIQ